MTFSNLARRVAAFVAFASGCGPESAGGDGSQSGGESQATDDGEDDRDDAATATATLDDGATADATSAGETGNVTDMCLLGDPDACPEGCSRDHVMQVIDGACGTTSVQICTPGGPKPALPPSTWWAIGPSGPLFIMYGGNNCSAGAQPTGWTECAGVMGEPADCACFCQQGYCPGDADRKALDSCGLEPPCPSLVLDEGFDSSDPEAESCVLAALRDHVPGIYEIKTSSSFSSETVRYYVFDGSVQRIVKMSDDVSTCPETSDWSGASTCLLESSSYFEACLATPPPGEECVLAPDLWVTDCENAPASCG